MTKVAIIRCEKNENRCPLTNCFKCMVDKKQAFAGYDGCVPAGVFTCRCPGDNAVEFAKILKAKGAEAIHFCTCAFAKKTDKGWMMQEGGFCSHLDEIIENVHNQTGLPCIKGTAHLPEDYQPRIWSKEV
ncbi:MAG: CGGC domain-containing protein [Desulfobacterales bacterium]